MNGPASRLSTWIAVLVVWLALVALVSLALEAKA